jgi:hypothetical protein
MGLVSIMFFYDTSKEHSINNVVRVIIQLINFKQSYRF